jgi:glycerophosphoryl diester phosphodiesterase
VSLSDYFGPPAPRVLAHRGLAVDAPENTLLAFDRAVAVGARYLETDVHVSADGVAVIAHDPRLARVAGRPEAVADLAVAELERVDLGSSQGFATLAEALHQFPELRFNIDVKTDAAVDATVSAIEHTGARQRVLLTSFSDRRRRRIATRLPGVATSVGSAGVVRSRLATAVRNRSLFLRALAGAGALQIPERVGRIRLVSPALIAAAHAVGAEVHVWTVNDPGDMERLLDLGVDGLVTDRADLALALIASRT